MTHIMCILASVFAAQYRQRSLYFSLLAMTFFAALTAPNAIAHEPARMTIYVTVDWEGWSLDDENLEAMRTFRKQFPHIPMLQFLNPVYFLRTNVDAPDTYNKIRETMRDHDTHGLHIHAWKSLVDRCGLSYQSAPTFADKSEQCEAGECGYSVSLEFAYTQAELNQLVACSSDLLVSQGFKRPTSFRAGGWQLGPKLAKALQHNGFKLDSSRTSASFLSERWGSNSNMVKMVGELHAGSDVLDQPYALLDGLLEYPNNASLADYTSTTQILEMFNTLIKNKKSVMILGFHQETAYVYLDRLTQAIPKLEQQAKAAGVTLIWASQPIE